MPNQKEHYRLTEAAASWKAVPFPIIDQLMKTGVYGKPEDVVPAALRSPAEDWDDLNSIDDRSTKARSAHSVIEDEFRIGGL